MGRRKFNPLERGNFNGDTIPNTPQTPLVHMQRVNWLQYEYEKLLIPCFLSRLPRIDIARAMTKESLDFLIDFHHEHSTEFQEILERIGGYVSWWFQEHFRLLKDSEQQKSPERLMT